MSTISKIEAFIYQKLGKENDGTITLDTPLLDVGLVDSIIALLLVDFIEAEFDIEFLPNEVRPENLNTLRLINSFIDSKKEGID